MNIGYIAYRNLGSSSSDHIIEEYSGNIKIDQRNVGDADTVECVPRGVKEGAVVVYTLVIHKYPVIGIMAAVQGRTHSIEDHIGLINKDGKARCETGENSPR
ncbi:MAG: hypothetical protein WCK10_02065 [Candidatus Staskawiczbacteria bacterium]